MNVTSFKTSQPALLMGLIGRKSGHSRGHQAASVVLAVAPAAGDRRGDDTVPRSPLVQLAVVAADFANNE